MIPHLLETYLGLLLVACTVAIAARRIRVPYTVALVLVGLVIAFLRLAPGVVISKDVIFTLILPPLLFYGSLEMDLADLQDNWVPIAALAVPGVLVSTLLVGWLVHEAWGISLLAGLLLGALLTPTDPVSVLAVCRSVNAPKRLRVILEGESLFNDGTGVVIFGMILGMIGGHDSFHLGGTLLEFLKVTLGGTFVGAVLGYLVYRVLALTTDHLVEVTLTVVLAFGASLVAEALHTSGIIATVVAGLVIGNYGRVFSMSARARETVEHFWDAVGFIVNSFLFLLIGLELQAFSLSRLRDLWMPILCVLGAVHLARALTVYPIIWIERRLRPEVVAPAWSHVFYWGGLKGSIPLALAVGLPQSFPLRKEFLVVAFVVVLVSLVMQGLTMRPLLIWLGLSQRKGA